MPKRGALRRAATPSASTGVLGTVSRRQPPAVPAARARREAERDLVERLRAGDAVAFAGLVDAYHRMLMHLATAFVPSREVAEDVVQETWLAVVDGIAGFHGSHSLRSWICAIAVRRAKARASKDGRSVPFSALEATDVDDAAGGDDRLLEAEAPAGAAWAAYTPEAILATAEATEALQRAVDGLPAGMRAVLVLRDVEGLSPAEACHILGISEVSHRVALHRARARLQRALAGILKEAE